MRKILRWTVTSMLMILLVLIAIPFLVPMNSYKPALESQLSHLMQRPVMIGSLRLEILPTAGLSAEGISAWSKEAGRGEIFIKAMRLEIDLPRLLFEGIPSIRQIRVEGLAANQRFIDTALKEFTRQGAHETSFTRLERLTARNVTVRMNDGHMLGPYWLDITLTPEYAVERAKLGRMDRSLKIKLTRAPQGYRVRMDASDWTLPVSPPLHFNHIQAHGTLDSEGLRLEHVETRAYQGRLEGSADITWQQGWRLTARTSLRSIQMEPLVSLFGGGGFRGWFSGDLNILMSAPRAGQLLQDPRITGDFTITEGVISYPDRKTPVFAFETFSARGALRRDSLTTSGSRLVTHGGVITGDTMTSWRPQWAFRADLDTEGVDVERLLDGLTKRKIVSGRLSGQVSVNLAGKHFRDLLGQPTLTGRLRLAQGRVFRPVNKNPAHSEALFHFDALSSDLALSPDKLESRNTEISAYGGRITGTSTLSWNSGWRYQAEIKARDIDSAALLQNILDEKFISGNLNGQAAIALAGPDFSSMLDDTDIEGRFRFNDGIFFKADLERAGNKLARQEVISGQTAFQEFKGKIRLVDGSTLLDDIRLTSSALQVRGTIKVDPQKQIHGQLTLGIRKTAQLTSIPVIVSGTTLEPHLRPSNSVLLGGVVGTTLLGPGIGTAVGIKVGESLGKMLSAIGGRSPETP